MSQTTLDDDELFSEAASEMREDVDAALAEARASLPAADAIWTVEADNVLGVLNGLRSSLDTGSASDHLRDAKKWYTIGERADAFSNAEELMAEIEAVEELLEQIEDAHGSVTDLAATLPELRGALEEAGSGEPTPEADGDADAEVEAEAE
ncbi:MAG: DUF5790 family protein [Phycisphaeraceae bacterium]|nr:DUF5790 family protein [Phycisphaeraceae bacterium]